VRVKNPFYETHDGRGGAPPTTSESVEPENGYEIDFRWKEQVVYWEGAHGLVFPGGWGVDPVVTVVPDASTWDRAVPEWLRGRHTEVVARLRADARHVVREEHNDSVVVSGYDEVNRSESTLGERRESSVPKALTSPQPGVWRYLLTDRPARRVVGTPDDLDTERLRLRPPTDNDVPALTALLQDEQTRAHLGGPLDLHEARRRAATFVGTPLVWTLSRHVESTVIGMVAMRPRADDLEVIYQLLPSYWGLGLAREAVEGLLAVTLAPVGPLESVVAVTQRANERSRRLLDALAFTEEAQFEEHGATQCLYRRSATDI
jgi:RimJ/RimL family protein N-acetyltransferase